MAESAAFCSSCGEALSNVSEMATAVNAGKAPRHASGAPPATPPASTGAHTPSGPSAASIGRISTTSSFHGGFAPGTILSERYRIIGLLGRGGMGEVYRADDLKLGAAVALKFLPRAFERDASLMERFLAEVRIARQVSHPNVCRVFDIAEYGSQHFLSMEFVDGEDLATLLKRIGRLPPAKALEIARQLCAGLAAAHGQGVLHRDLKPANVMLDGHGRARITDFGLAVPAGDTSVKEVSGTPAYMAPEVLEGRGATVQSDLYALGLVLYEIFTGKRVFEAASFREWKKAHSEDAPVPPSQHSADIEPAVERAILRCLEKDPAKRPASAMQLAAALPGGDPLAAALAAGETPSPEMVAAAGAESALSAGKAWTLLGAVVVLLAGVLALAPYTSMVALTKLEKSPEVLKERARALVKGFGFEDNPADKTGWFTRDSEYVTWRGKEVPWPQRVRELEKAEPAPVWYMHRQSPRPLSTLNNSGVVSASDPPMEFSGMVNVVLDARGRLIFFRALAPQYEEQATAAAPVDWSKAFAEAELDFARFQPVEPRWNPQVPYDTRMAWEGSRAADPNIKLHVTAAAYRGRLVWFAIAGPWSRPSRQEQTPQSFSARVAAAMSAILTSALLIGCALFARRNFRMGRGDTRGGFRIALAMTLFGMAAWAFSTHHTNEPAQVFTRFMAALGEAVFGGAFLFLIYLALEPFVRRRMPHLLVSWTRLLSGTVRDPLVGHHVLLGILTGMLLVFLARTVNALPYWFDIPGVPLPTPRFSLAGPAGAFGMVFSAATQGLVDGMAILGLLFLMRAVLRKYWVAIAVLGLLLAVLFVGDGTAPAVQIPLAAVSSVVVMTVLVRTGLLAGVAAWVTYFLLSYFNLPLDLSRWYGWNLLPVIVLLLSAAGFAFHAALGGKPMFGAVLIED